MKRTSEEAVRANILQAAEKVFQKWGLNKTTMDDIAQAAGRCKGSLYYYYKNKEEIFFIVMSKYITEILDKATKEIDDHSSMENKLKSFLLTVIEEFNKYANLFDVIRGEIKGYPEVIEAIIEKFESASLKLLNDIIGQGINNGEFKSYNKKKIELVCYIITGFMYNLTFDYYVENKPYNMKERLNIFIEILVDGLRRGSSAGS